MALIKIGSFAGMTPKLGDRLLPENAAVLAENCKLYSGTLRPLRPPAVSSTPIKTNPFVSLFRARSGASSAAWFTWATDVDCVRVPLSTDVESRFVWTGDGVPKMAKYSGATASGTNNYPDGTSNTYYTLGIPAPQTIPAASVQVAGAQVTARYYVYTFISADGEESAPSPVSLLSATATATTWRVTLPDVSVSNGETCTAAYGSVTTVTDAAAAKHWLRVGDEIYFTAGAGIVTTLLHTVASVTSATVFTVTGNYATATAWVRKAYWNTTGMTKRLYRTTSGSTAAFQLVVASIAMATTYYDDSLLDDVILGDDLLTAGWVPPPVGLTNVCVHSSGALCGFVNNIVYFSEPLQPHAWPLAYTLSAGASGIGMATFGSAAVLATLGAPFVMVGADPASMTGEEIQGTYPCVAKRSVIGVQGGVLYASNYGLVSVGQQGASVFSAPFYSKDEWAALVPSTMVCASASGRIYIKYIGDTQRVLIFDGGNLTTSTVLSDELYSDPSTGELYTTSGSNILLWDSTASVPLYTVWRSKEFIFPAPVNLGAGKVEFLTALGAADSALLAAVRAAIVAANDVLIATGVTLGSIDDAAYNVYDINGSTLSPVPAAAVVSGTVTLNLYRGADELLVASRVLSDNSVFRLPAGYKDDAFFIEVITQSEVEEIRIAETPDGLRAN